LTERGQSVVLLVDDDEGLAALASEFLDGEGFATLVAHTGKAALKTLSHQPVDVVVLDLHLPDVDGLEVLAAARRLESPPDVVIATGHASLESAVTAIEADVAGYILKPFTPDRLGEMVARVVRRRGLARQNARLSAELAARLAQAEALLAISSTIGSTLDLTEALRRVCRELVRFTGADTCAAYLHDRSRDVLVPTAAYHVPSEFRGLLAASTIPLGEAGLWLVEDGLLVRAGVTPVPRRRPRARESRSASRSSGAWRRAARRSSRRTPPRTPAFSPSIGSGSRASGPAR
jgi:DNA-binding response OmpR family regulator